GTNNIPKQQKGPLTRAFFMCRSIRRRSPEERKERERRRAVIRVRPVVAVIIGPRSIIVGTIVIRAIVAPVMRPVVTVAVMPVVPMMTAARAHVGGGRRVV